ncbi:MAG: phosphonate metabolism protein [Microvirga sp.]|jgi:putative phosphonate metabolism protein|nr:phosphonate metabolism protein [Microvirga sp.]
MMTDRTRYALYFTPAQGSALERFGAAVLGYDCYTSEAVSHPELPGISPAEVSGMTAEPRRYGFHATLKPPFALKVGQSVEALREAAAVFAASRTEVTVGRLKVSALGPFIALVPTAPPVELGLLAAECVATLDGFRAPLSEVDRRKRPGDGLSPRQQALQARWGYPYVLDEFRFHMTLTGGLPHDRRPVWLEALVTHADEFLLTLDAITLLIQPRPDSPFAVLERFSFQGGA